MGPYERSTMWTYIYPSTCASLQLCLMSTLIPSSEPCESTMFLTFFYLGDYFTTGSTGFQQCQDTMWWSWCVSTLALQLSPWNHCFFPLHQPFGYRHGLYLPAGQIHHEACHYVPGKQMPFHLPGLPASLGLPAPDGWHFWEGHPASSINQADCQVIWLCHGGSLTSQIRMESDNSFSPRGWSHPAVSCSLMPATFLLDATSKPLASGLLAFCKLLRSADEYQLVGAHYQANPPTLQQPIGMHIMSQYSSHSKSVVVLAMQQNAEVQIHHILGVDY